MTRDSGDARDAARTLAILWGTQDAPTRGPKPGLTIARVVAAALAIADSDEGIDGLSMRRVARELGVGTMSVYTYIASKAELIDVMLDAVYAETADMSTSDPPVAPTTERDWRTDLRRVADTNWQLHLRHPWTLDVFTGRPNLGPNAIAKYERELAAIDGLGLTDVEMDAVLTLVHNHAEGMARRYVGARQAVQRSGITDLQWWEATAPVFAQVYDAERFPLATRVGAAAGGEYDAAHDPEHAYRFGLERLLDGIAALLD